MNFQEVLNHATQLSTLDKVRLIQQLAFNIEREVENNQSSTPQPQSQQPPAWNPSPNYSPPPDWNAPSDGQRLSNEEINKARWEDWANFPD